MKTKGFQTCVPSRWELEMTDLEALVVAAYVFADEYPVPARGGRPPLTSDAELVALAVAQAAIGISSDRQFLGLVGKVLPGWFAHLPDQSQYNRRLRGLVELISIVQQQLARWLDTGGVRLADGSQLAVASYAGCEQRSGFVSASPATASPARGTATSGASGWCSSPTAAVCRSATPSCRPTSTSSNRSPTCSRARPRRS